MGKEINWDLIEERLANTDDLPDCMPVNVREWSRFQEQYDNALDFIANYKTKDFSHKDMTPEFLEEKKLEIGCLGYGFKHSIFEVLQDGRSPHAGTPVTDLIPELDWKLIKNFELFFRWTINLNNIKVLLPVPQYVGGDFFCSVNQLTTLKGVPQYVGGDFHCDYNQLTTLEGAPQYVGGDFRCGNNQLITLKGAPQYVGGYFYCGNYNYLPDSIPNAFKGSELSKYINLKESKQFKYIKTFEAFVWTEPQDMLGYFQRKS